MFAPLEDPQHSSSETQGQIKGARESLNGRENIYGTKKSKERREELFSPFFTFLRATFSRPFRISLVPTICPWVSEDAQCCALVRPASRNALCAGALKRPPYDPSWEIILFISSAASAWTSVCINIYEKDQIL